MPPKKSKPPNLVEDKLKKSKSQSFITNEDYDEIFDAVINKQESSHAHHLLNFKSPLVGKSPEVDAFSPKECASLENSQSTSQEKKQRTPNTRKTRTELVISSNKPKQVYSESSNNQSESVSTIYSEEFRKKSTFSTPMIKAHSNTKKQKSFREAVKNLKDTESQLSESLLTSLSQAHTSLNNSLLVDTPLSQPPANLNHRERLLWLQARRGDNVFVQCDSCDKWRLSDVQDPVDLPDKWYCRMNKDVNFNNCLIPEQKLSIYVEADIIVNQYTAGTLVWAKVLSYPWWPAMVDDDPDTEQFYWIDDYDLNIPTSYNVTFFDRKNEPVTRAWITTKNLKSFKHNLTIDKKKVPVKYRARIKHAKEQALEAMELPIKERLHNYSFISKTRQRINTPIGTPAHSECGDESYLAKNLKPKTNKKRRNTVDDPAAHLKNIFVHKTKKELEMTKNINNKQDETKVSKNVRKRRNTIVELNTEKVSVQNDNKEKKIQQHRGSVPEGCSQGDCSQETIKPQKVTRRRDTRGDTSFERNTRGDTSIEKNSSFSQETVKEKKITKRRKTVGEYELKTLNQASGKLEKVTKENKVQRRRNSIPDRLSQRDGSQDLLEPKTITKRRNTRGNTSIERDGSFSQDSTKEKKITKRRKTISDIESSKDSLKSVIEKKTNKIESVKEGSKIQKRQTSIPEKNAQRDSSKDLEVPKRVTRRRNTRGDTSIERDSSFSQDSNKEKKITKRRKTISDIESSKDSLKSVIEQNTNKIENAKKNDIQRRRNSIPDRLSQRDGSQDLEVPKRVTRRRDTRGDTSIERDSSLSQDSNKEKKITKRRKTISNIESSKDSLKSVIDQKTNKTENDKESSRIQRRRNSIPDKLSERDSSQDLVDPKKITKRRNTRGNTSTERDSSFSQDSVKEKTITKRRKTIGERDAQTEKDSQKTITEQNSNTLKNGNNDNFSERDDSQNSNASETNRSNRSCDTSVDRETSLSGDSTKCGRVIRRRKTIGKYEKQLSGAALSAIEQVLRAALEPENKKDERNSQRDNSQNTLGECDSQNSQNDINENKTKRRRNTINEKDSQTNSSQNSDKSQKICKRRNTLANTSIESENSFAKNTTKQEESTNKESDSQKENKTRRNPIREKDNSRRESSQNSDESRKITKRRSTRLDCSVEKENSSSQESQKKKKITKRRTTIAVYNYQTEESENSNTHNSEVNKISDRRNTIEKESSFKDLSMKSDSGVIIKKQRSKFVCPIQNVTALPTKSTSNFSESFNESQSEVKKSRKTLGARKIVSSIKPKNTMGTESGYESAMSMKKGDEKKLNLSTILEESCSKTENILKKRRHTTEGQEKKIDEKKKLMDDDEELEKTFTSLSQSLEQLDIEKRKKKFMAICQEIVNIDKDPDDPTISEEEKLFYEKLNSSLKQVKEKQDSLTEDKIVTKFDEVETISKDKDFFKTSNTSSTVTSANTSMHSDVSVIEFKVKKKINNKRSSSDTRQPKRKTQFNED